LETALAGRERRFEKCLALVYGNELQILPAQYYLIALKVKSGGLKFSRSTGYKMSASDKLTTEI